MMILAAVDVTSIVIQAGIGIASTALTWLVSAKVTSAVLMAKVRSLESSQVSIAVEFRDLARDLKAEREARHALAADQTDRTHVLEADLKENYPQRRETMRQFGTTIQRLDALRVEIIAEIKGLPCVGPRIPPRECPGAQQREAG